MKKKHLAIVVRLVLAGLAIGYIAYALDWQDSVDADGLKRDGVLTTLGKVDVGLALTAAAILGLVYPLTALRWWLLMRARGLDVSPWKSFRLVMVGCLFNYVMPGTTGGDVVKAYYAAKGSGRKADAIMTVIVDRLSGLFGLVTLAGVAGLITWGDPIARQTTLWVGGFVLTILVGAALYFSGWLHKLLRLDRWLHKLPGGGLLAKVDEAANAYRDHKTALLLALMMGMIGHVCTVSATALSGQALGMTVQFSHLFVILPVLFICAALPITPQGLGTTEWLGKAMIVNAGLGADFNQLVGMLMLWRLYQVVYSLVFGSVFLLQGDIHLHRQLDNAEQVKQKSADAEVSV